MADSSQGPAETPTGVVESGAPANDGDFSRGLALLEKGELEDAIQHLERALRTAVETHGELSLEAASRYFHLGRALLYEVQSNSDFLSASGTTKVTQEEAKEDDDEAGPSGQPNDDDEAGPSTAPEPSEEQEEEEDASDLQVAWEHFETAKLIWSKDAAKYASELADVHVHLGDIGLENEAFQGALSDYQEAAEHLERQQTEPSSSAALARRRAEVLYKQGMAWQFLDNAAEALGAVQAAAGVLKAVSSEVEREEMAALQSELEQKVEELQAAVAEQASATATVKSLLQQYTGALAGALGGEGTKSFEEPQKPAAVKDLGVIGRGTKRVTLQPIAQNAPEEKGKAISSSGTDDVPKKRRLEDLMGPVPGGETTTGF